MATASVRVTTHCIYLVGVPLSLAPPISHPVFSSGARPLSPLARGTRRWVPPFCARIVTPSTRSTSPPPSPSRDAVLQCLATPGHCYQYCYYYRYCCRLRPSGEWKSRGPVEPAATSSVALEANYTPSPPPPSGPPIVAFIPPLHFTPLFRKVSIYRTIRENLSVISNLCYPKRASCTIAFSSLRDEDINNVHYISELYSQK